MFTKATLYSFALTATTALVMVVMLNYLMAFSMGIGPAAQVDARFIGVLLFVPAALGGVMMPNVRAALEYACVGVLIGLGFFVLSLYTSTVPGIEAALVPLILHANILTLFTYSTAAVGLAIVAGGVAGFGLAWGRNLQKRIARKGK